MRARPRGRIVLLRREGARFEARPLTGPDAYVDGVSASPDGRSIAYVTLGLGGGGHVQTMTLANGEVHALGHYAGLPGIATAWSPDATRLAVTGQRADGTSGLWTYATDRGLLDAEGVAWERPSTGAHAVQWLDDRTVAYPAAGSTALLTVDVKSGAQGELFAPKDGFVSLGEISPDRKRILVDWNRKDGPVGVYLLHVSDRHMERVADTRFMGALTWDTDKRILLRAIDTSKARELFAAEAGKVQSLGELPIDGPYDALVGVAGGLVVQVDTSTSDAWIAEDFDPDVR